MAQINCIQPKVILILGKASYDALHGNISKIPFAKSRGQWSNICEIPVMTSYETNYLLQNDSLGTKREFWEDMLKILAKLDYPISDKQKKYFLSRSKS